MNPLTKFLVTFVLPVVTAIAIALPIAGAVTHSAVADANRTSAVNSCLAANKSHDGIEKLIKQLEDAAAKSGTLSAAEKAQREAFYAQLTGDFPALDCTANPIIFKP